MRLLSPGIARLSPNATKPAPRFGTEYVWNHGQNQEYPLVVTVKPEQFEPALKRIEASNAAVRDAVIALTGAMSREFKLLQETLKSSRLTMP